MVDFLPTPSAQLSPGLVLYLPGNKPTYLRLTHLFDTCIYAMWVGDANQVRTALRPHRLLFHELDVLISTPGSQWGRIPLPNAFSNTPESKSERGMSLDATWKIVGPLLEEFDDERNLYRDRFTQLISRHAKDQFVSHGTLRRWVLRYYYFGRSRLALLHLPTGSAPGVPSNTAEPQAEDSAARSGQRRGPKPVLSSKLGENDFLVQEEDIVDMRHAMHRMHLRGKATQTGAHESYLANEFRARHPDLYDAYTQIKRPIPVTLRQFRYYTRGPDKSQFESPYQPPESGIYIAASYADGPGDTTEIDSTGGRIFLRQKGRPEVCLGQPTVYLAIDRWSRYVLSAYMSLASPSYEELRYTLLIAFTSRIKRFAALDVDIDDARWPPGKISARLCLDRGSECLCDSAQQSIVNDLRIELNILPPACPDGKSIVERLIGVLKKRMASKGTRGAYADRPMDRASRKVAKAARTASIYSLADAYRELVSIIEDHNNRPHKTLKRYEVLAEAGVEPTPKSAYLWGLKYKTGRHSPVYCDDDYYRILLSTDTASLSNRALLYRNRVYRPADMLAWNITNKSTTRGKQVTVRVDKTEPSRIFVPTKHHDWAAFDMMPGALLELHGVTLDEEDARAKIKLELAATAEHDAQRRRIIRQAGDTKQRTRSISPQIEDAHTQRTLRTKETEDLKKRLNGSDPQENSSTHSMPSQPFDDWQEIERAERAKKVALIRQRRKAK